MRILRRIATVSLAVLIVGAAPAPTYVPLGKYDEGLIIPAGSPVRFQRFLQYDRARFSGRFRIEGVFVVDCSDCEPGITGSELHLAIVPDPVIAGRLPHWKVHDNDIAIDITDADSFIRTIVTPNERRELLSGKRDEVRGWTAIIADHYEAGLDCDSANYSARFVSIARPPKIAKAELKGNFGCGFV